VPLGKALNGIASTFEWLDRNFREVIRWQLDSKTKKSHSTVSWKRELGK